MLQKIRKVISCRVLCVVAVIFCSAFMWVLWHKGVRPSDTSYDGLIKQFPFLSKRVLKDNENDLLIHFIPLRKQLREKAATYGDSFAFYFEYLPTGISIGVNEKIDYEVASLLKVPFVMAYFLGIEDSGIELQRMVTIDQSEIDDRFGTLWKKGVGASVSIDQVIEYALTESDNTAVNILKRQVEMDHYLEIYKGLDIDVPEPNKPVQLSAKSYASILKALYFSSILNREHSERILDLLTRSVFHDKLPAGLPESIPVAHKIGVNYNILYQDCGIVYEPKRPYLLCLISQSAEDVATARMKEISAMVYQYIHSVK